MKIFTKLLLPVFLIASCFTGYGAGLAFGISGEGIYIPKSTMATTAGVTAWIGKSGSRLVDYSLKSTDCWAGLDKHILKSIGMPKKISYAFTANASGSSNLGLHMINTTQGWDEGRMKPSLSAYPNPSKGMIEVELQTTNESGKLALTSNQSYKINFSNTIGQVIKSIKVPKSALDSKIKIDLSDYPAGVYFYSLLVNDKMVETKRLILQQ